MNFHWNPPIEVSEASAMLYCFSASGDEEIDRDR